MEREDDDDYPLSARRRMLNKITRQLIYRRILKELGVFRYT